MTPEVIGAVIGGAVIAGGTALGIIRHRRNGNGHDVGSKLDRIEGTLDRMDERLLNVERQVGRLRDDVERLGVSMNGEAKEEGN